MARRTWCCEDFEYTVATARFFGCDNCDSEFRPCAARLFNSSLDGNARRAIDIHEGEEVDESAFKALVRRAVALNSSGKSKPSNKAKS